MKRQSLVLIAVAIAGAGATGCFKDPVSNLRNGPAVMSVTSSAVFLRTGDSINVTATLLDEAGNVMPLTDSATWTTADPSIALAHNDHSLTVPGDAYSRGTIVAVDSVSGGWTNVIVAARGLADTIRVVVMPAKLSAQHIAYAGPTLTDTVIVPGNALTGAPPSFVGYTAPDTLILNGTSLLKFDTSKVTVQINTSNGASKGLIVSKTPDQLMVVFQAGAAGKVLAQHLLLTPGNASVGTIQVDSLMSDSVAVAPWHIGSATFGGDATVASNVVTVTAGTGMTFDSTTTAAFRDQPAILVGRTSSTLTLLSPINDTGAVEVYHIRMAVAGTGVDSITFDSLSSATGALATTAIAATFDVGNANLGDTISITLPAGVLMTPTTAVLCGDQEWPTSDTAWVISQTASSIKAFAKRGGTSPITVINLDVPASRPGAQLFKLQTPNSVTISTTTSDFPGGGTMGTARPLTIPANDTAVTYGATPPSGLDFWTFTTTASHVIHGEVAWFGSGDPYASNSTDSTDDIDFLICNASTKCDESGADLSGFQGATTSQPEVFTTASLPADQYWLGVYDFNADYAIVYKMTIVLE
jgi:hypothetical protein